MAASVDQTSGSIFLTPLTELATPNSHTVTQNCTASWTTRNKYLSCQTWKIFHTLVEVDTKATIALYLKWFSSKAWSWWWRLPFPLVGRRSQCLWGTGPASPASSTPHPHPPSPPPSVGLAASSDWPQRCPHQSLIRWLGGEGGGRISVQNEDKKQAEVEKQSTDFSPVRCRLIIQHFLQLLYGT